MWFGPKTINYSNIIVAAIIFSLTISVINVQVSKFFFSESLDDFSSEIFNFLYYVNFFPTNLSKRKICLNFCQEKSTMKIDKLR